MMLKWMFLLGCLPWIPYAALELQPIIQHYFEPSVVRACDDFRFHCEILRPYNEVWWTQNGSKLENLTTFIDDHHSNITIAKLYINCAQPEHVGNYTCHVRSANTLAHNSIFFAISQPLTIHLNPSVAGTLGERVVLNCTIRGHLLPSSIHWTKEDVHVESSEVINVSQRVINASEITSSLEIFNLTEKYLGCYVCSANSSDEVTRATTCVIDKVAGLSPPSEVGISILDPHSVKVKWRGDFSIDRYEIKILENGESQNPKQIIEVTSWLKYGKHIHHQQKISSLEPNKHYVIKIMACNHHFGCSNESWSDNVTLPGYSSPPSNVLLTCHYDNISMGSYIHAVWDAPSQPQSDILKYKINIIGSANFINGHGLFTNEPNKKEMTTNKTYVKIPVSANTNYSLQVCAVTSVGCGHFNNDIEASNCLTSPTVPNKLPDFELQNVEPTGECCRLKLNMKRISQRNGPIKCYRVILYKMKNEREKVLSPEDIPLLSYDEVHKDSGYGAYVAEAFNEEKFKREIILGDDVQSQCKDRNHRALRSIISNDDDDKEDEFVHDGELMAETFYTGFVEVKVIGKDDVILTKRSSLFMPIRTGANNYNIQATALGVICGLVIVIIVLAIALCALSKRHSPNDYDGGYHLCKFCGWFGWSQTTGMAGMPVLPPPDLKPLKPENLPTTFHDRHKDSDLLFQREFEALPEAFRDRTTNASDMVENFFKNRYPDIKAYDQTRVKLSVMDGIAGSDYINANYVMGYKERKKFICAQGPLEKTVNDFWRMIWEQKVTIIVMVTCLEENGKKKCTKYWPDDVESQFGNLTVTLVNSKSCSDSVVRNLTVCAKKEEGLSETREVIQYHYLTWKDWLAPEHPGGILKFIKCINEGYTSDNGPILIHCSAGVGRTGTLVVIDSLLQQMKEEGQVEIFNFIVSVRRQRNFLVQSLKQYIFVYRALMEFAQFGDTEMKVSSLATQYSQLCTQIRSGKSALKAEFEKLNQIVEDVKTCDIATMDVNANKNRFPTVVPYDRNRVILTPVPSREHSSYINASYIQGYDRACSFIITQDPMEGSTNEFWRMIHEQNSSLVIMLSHHSALKYWPEDKVEYDHITVGVESTEELGRFTKREFTVTNTNRSKSHNVLHYHFNEWTAEVPSDTAGIIELIKKLNFKPATVDENESPVIVHCSEAGHHSGVFIACCILAMQIEHEQQIDVFQLARNMRSHRSGLFQNFESYKFCYQFALDYSGTLDSTTTDVV